MGIQYRVTDAWFCGPGLAHCRAGERTLLNPLATSQEGRLVTPAIELELVPVRGIDLITFFPVHFLRFTETTTILPRELHHRRVGDHRGGGHPEPPVSPRGGVVPAPPFRVPPGRTPRAAPGNPLENEFGVRIDWGNEIGGRLEAGFQPTHRLWLNGYTEAMKSGDHRTNTGERQDQFQSFWSVAPKAAYRLGTDLWIDAWVVLPLAGRNLPADPALGAKVSVRLDILDPAPPDR